jgi:myo-inositol-1(or 4)-monophosphatase
VYSAAVERALAVAVAAHADQRRKGNGDPYAVHPLHMALELARLGLDEVTVQAALLHDVVEDCEGWDRSGIEHAFGREVAAVVAELTEDKAQSWEQRKRAALEHVPHLSPRALVVKAADVLHNLVSLERRLAECGDVPIVWNVFRGGRTRTLEQHRRMVALLLPRAPAPLAEALAGTLERVLAACGIATTT